MATNDFFEYEPKDPVNDSNLTGRYRHGWVEENLPHFNANGRNNNIPRTNNFIGASISPKRMLLFLILSLIGTVVIASRVFYLQVIKGDYYFNLAENNRIRIKPISSERGLVYDRYGKQIVENIPSFSLSIVPYDLPRNNEERANLISKISTISNVGVEEIENLIKKYSDYSYESLIIKENLDYESALRLYVQSSELNGIIIEKGTKRLYGTVNADENINNKPSSLSHIIGYLGKIDINELSDKKSLGYYSSDYLGKAGIEKQYESNLRGIFGRKRVEVNALGREQNILAEEPPIPGKNIYLSIDLEAQNYLENLLLDSMEKNSFARVAGIALNPNNGEILALVSLPSFDNNDFSGGISETKYSAYLNNENNPLFNRAIAGTYPSGSTVKPLITAAALQEKIITKNTSVLSTGGIEVDKWFFRDWKAGGHGYTNATKAIAWSVNTFFYYIGGGYKSFVGLGVDKIISYLKQFGLAEKTGIDLPGESAGFLPSKAWKEETKNEMWYIGDTYNLSIGQGDLLVTPLQVAVWTATIANGGKVIQPRLAVKIEDPLNKTEEILPTIIKNENFISSANINISRQGMRECVIYGSCEMLGSLNFSSAGKTGTAQWSQSKENHAWFTSFAPFDNPQIVVTILIEEGEEGSTAAQPIALDFLRWWGKKYLK